MCVGWMEGFFKLLLFCRCGVLAKTTSIYSCFKAYVDLFVKGAPNHDIGLEDQLKHGPPCPKSLFLRLGTRRRSVFMLS